MLIENDSERPTIEELKTELDTLISDDLFKREVGYNLPLLD